MANLKLEYSFNANPYPIRVSGVGDTNTIDLLVTISQPGPAVAVQSITIEIPVGENADNRLAVAPLPSPNYDTSGLWNITTSGSVVTIQPRSGSSAEVVTTIEFNLPGIVVNDVIGIVPITITEFAPAKLIDPFTYRLEKLASDFPIRKFYASPTVLDDLDQTATIYWECSAEGTNYSYRLHTVDVEADQGYGWMPKECLISGDCYSCDDGKAGVRTPQLAEDTTFALDVIKADPSGTRVIHKTLFVTVRVQVPYFSQAARLVRMLGSFVFLRWRAFNASRVTVRLNDDIIDANAPVDSYVDGYMVTLGENSPRAHFHLTAHARNGDAVAYYAAYPDLSTQQQAQINLPNQWGDAPAVPTSVAAAANVNLAVAGCHDDEAARLIDLSARQIRTLNAFPGVSYLQAVAMTPDGKQLIVGGQGVRGFDASNGNQLWAEGNNCDGMVMAANGSVLLITYANFVAVIDMKNPGAGSTPISNPYPGYPPGQAGKMLTLAVSADGTVGILGMMGGYNAPLSYLTVLNIPQRNSDPKTIALSGYTVAGVAISASGKLALATVYKGDGSGAVMFIDVPNRTVTNTMPLEGSTIPPSGAIVVGDSYAFILVSDNTNHQRVLVLDLAQKKVVATLDTGGKATALALGPDNSSLIVTNDGGVLII